MHNSFGYLTQQGYLGVRFPVVFGETGSFYTSVRHQLRVRARTLPHSCQGTPGMARCAAWGAHGRCRCRAGAR